MHPHQQYGAGSPGTRGALQPQMQPQQQQQPQQPPPQQQQQQPDTVNANDLSFEFLDNLNSGDTSNFIPQDLLNSLESGYLDGIL